MNDVFRNPAPSEMTLAVARGNTFEAFVGASLIAKSHVSVLKKQSESSTVWSFYYCGSSKTGTGSLLLRIRIQNSVKESLQKTLDMHVQHAVGAVFLRRYCPEFKVSRDREDESEATCETTNERST